MNYLNELKKYYNHKFDTSWANTQDYLNFQKIYISYLRRIFKQNDFKIVKTNTNHFEFSIFINTNNTYVYISIPDVRYYQNEWYNNILIRKVNSINDYIGENNNFSNLENLTKTIKNITKKGI